MEKFQKYEEYLPTGIEWVDKLPLDWKVFKVKNLFSLITKPAPKDNNEELLSVYTDIGVRPRKDLEARGNKASTTDNYWLVKKGDIIVNKLLAWMGAIGISNYNGVTSPAYDILRYKKEVNPKFYNYLFRNKIIRHELKRHSKGIMDMRLRLYFDQFGQIRVPFPPLSQQNKIVKFIDENVTEIDKYIQLKEKTISILEERKAAIINQAVTKGLDPNVLMKNSEVEWLGEIPAHWDVKKMKYIAKKITDGEHISPSFEESGIPFLSAKDIRDRTINYEVNKFVTEKDAIRFRKRCNPEFGDLLIVSRGATVGRVGLMETKKIFCLLGSVILFKPQKEYSSLYLYYILSSKKVTVEFTQTSQASAQPAIYLTDVSEISIPVAPIQEQKEIEIFLDKQCNRIISMIKKIESEILLIKEYKESLIAATVTGKINVSTYKTETNYAHTTNNRYL